MSKASPGAEATRRIAAEIVAAYVSGNAISTIDLPKLIVETFTTIGTIEAPPLAVVAKETRPAVPINKSITPKYLVCLEDGLRFVSLKRHLSMHGMTPGEYKTKWGLPSDYPMVAPNHSAMRSAVAKRIGLGSKAAAGRARAAGARS